MNRSVLVLFTFSTVAVLGVNCSQPKEMAGGQGVDARLLYLKFKVDRSVFFTMRKIPDQSTGLHIADPFVGAHHKEVNPVKNGFLLGTQQQLAALGAVNDQDDVMLLAKACNRLQREDSSALAGHLERISNDNQEHRVFLTWSQSRTVNS